jgi:hypothetical protein
MMKRYGQNCTLYPSPPYNNQDAKILTNVPILIIGEYNSADDTSPSLAVCEIACPKSAAVSITSAAFTTYWPKNTIFKFLQT